MTESQSGDVLHGPEPCHVRLQANQLLVTEVNLRILDPGRLLQRLLDDLGSHCSRHFQTEGLLIALQEFADYERVQVLLCSPAASPAAQLSVLLLRHPAHTNICHHTVLRSHSQQRNTTSVIIIFS